MEVEIKNYKRYESNGAFQGYFTLVIPEPGQQEIPGCKHFKNAGGDWFNFPQKEVPIEGGGKEYYPYTTFKNYEYLQNLKSAVYDALQEVSNESNKKARPTEVQGDTPADWF